MKKITIIAPSSFGYIDFLIDKLKERPDFEVTHINFSNYVYSYTSKLEKLKNAFNKIVLNQNIKDLYRSKCILEALSEKGKQDIIVVIRPDQIETKTLKTLKSLTNELYAFYFDAISNFPKKIDIIPVFDKVFSYEKEDVKQYDLEFITNYIYDVDMRSNGASELKVFNISSYDERFNQLKAIASYLKTNDIAYEILVRKERVLNDELITVIPEYLSLSEVKQLILKSDILLDIQKENQKGLSFRVFEALGYEKKLLTTNADVVNYDFYNPNNMLVLDTDNLYIPKEFLNSPYQKISEDILYPYTLDGWIDTLFST